jgi:hypothetical protein
MHHTSKNTVLPTRPQPIALRGNGFHTTPAYKTYVTKEQHHFAHKETSYKTAEFCRPTSPIHSLSPEMSMPYVFAGKRCASSPCVKGFRLRSFRWQTAARRPCVGSRAEAETTTTRPQAGEFCVLSLQIPGNSFKSTGVVSMK